MRTLIFSFFFFFILSFNSSAQNWFPIEIGNQWQYIESFAHSSVGSPPSYSYYINYVSITNDTVIANKKYFNGLYGSGLTGSGVWTRYDSLTQQIFVLCDSLELLHMDFTLPDTAYLGLLSTPYYCWAENEIWIYSDIDTFANVPINTKSFQWFEYGWPDFSYSINYVDGLGIFNSWRSWYSMGGHFSSHDRRLIQCNLSGNNISENYFPEIIIQPDSTLSDSILNLTFEVKHEYNHIFPEGTQNTSLNFIESVLFQSFYMKQDTLNNSTIFAQWIPGTETYQISIPLELNLLRNEYKFLYRIEAIDKGLEPHKNFSPETGYYIATLDTNTDVLEWSQNAINFGLNQNYPNPFNPTTKISWQSPVSGWQTLKVYDVLGNEIATLVNEEKAAGRYEVEFDAGKLSSGVYYYQLRAGSFIETKKLIYLK